MKASDLLPKACGEGVIFAPGGNFFLDPADGEGGMRLNFASNTEAVIEEGVPAVGQGDGRDAEWSGVRFFPPTEIMITNARSVGADTQVRPYGNCVNYSSIR